MDMFLKKKSLFTYITINYISQLCFNTWASLVYTAAFNLFNYKSKLMTLQATDIMYYKWEYFKEGLRNEGILVERARHCFDQHSHCPQETCNITQF